MAFPGGENPIARPQKQPLRPLTEDEKSELKRLSRSTTAPAAQVARAKALLTVDQGKSFAKAARECGQSSGDTVAGWVIRFNNEGLGALTPRHGGGAKLRYGPQDRESILAAARRLPKVGRSKKAAWSLHSLRQHLVQQGLPAPSTYTLWRILQDADMGPDIRSSNAIRDSRPDSAMATGIANKPSKKLSQE